jgi:hypothetical protein
VSIRTFFGEVLSDTKQLDKWMNKGWKKEEGEPPPRETLIKQSWQLTPVEKRILLTESELLISMRLLLFEGGRQGYAPGKEGGPGPGY